MLATYRKIRTTHARDNGLGLGSLFLDTIERSGGVGESVRLDIGVSTLPVNSVVNSGVNFPSQKSK
jgi:hypothetical protein